MPRCTHHHLMLSSAVLNCPLKCLAFRGAEVIFQWSVWNQNKISFYFLEATQAWQDWRNLNESERSMHAMQVFVQGESSGRQNGLPFSPQHRTTIVPLVKATKNKANLATDEVHMENRNHGLAWTDSGNNRTDTRLLIKANSKVVTKLSLLKEQSWPCNSPWLM